MRGSVWVQRISRYARSWTLCRWTFLYVAASSMACAEAALSRVHAVHDFDVIEKRFEPKARASRSDADGSGGPTGTGGQRCRWLIVIYTCNSLNQKQDAGGDRSEVTQRAVRRAVQDTLFQDGQGLRNSAPRCACTSNDR